MGRHEDEWDLVRNGRLDEREIDELGIFGHRAHGRDHVVRAIPARAMRKRLEAPVERVPELEKALRAAGFGRNYKVGVSPCHIRVSRLTRPRSIGVPKSFLSGDRITVAPLRGEVARTIEAGARRDTRTNVYTIEKSSAFLRTPDGARMAHPLAILAKLAGQKTRSTVRSSGPARRFQAYVERARLNNAKVREEVEFDEKGAISFGNLGRNFEERRAFWEKVSHTEKQGGAVLQTRMIAELPHWILPEDRREILARFSQVFVERGYGFWAVSHLPKANSGSNPRNIHAHIIWHDRFILKWANDGQTPLEFSEKKSRDDRGPEWIKFLRRKYVEAANSVILEAAKRDRKAPERLLHHGTYADLGIHITPQRHEGPKRTALRRAAMITRAGARNDRIVTIDQDVRLNSARRKFDVAIARLAGFRPLSWVLHSTHPFDIAECNRLTALNDDVERARRGHGYIEELLARPFERDPKRRNALVEDLERIADDIDRAVDPLKRKHDELQQIIEARRRAQEEYRRYLLSLPSRERTSDPHARPAQVANPTSPRPSSTSSPSSPEPDHTARAPQKAEPSTQIKRSPERDSLVVALPIDGSYAKVRQVFFDVFRTCPAARIDLLHQHTHAGLEFARLEHKRFPNTASREQVLRIERGLDLIEAVARERGVILRGQPSSSNAQSATRPRDRGSYER